jgi:hypothetical protein
MTTVAATAAIILAARGSGPIAVAGEASRIASARTLAPAAPFGIRSHCVRRVIVARDGVYARVDFDRSTVCGAAGNHVTLIMRRARCPCARIQLTTSPRDFGRAGRLIPRRLCCEESGIGPRRERLGVVLRTQRCDADADGERLRFCAPRRDEQR